MTVHHSPTNPYQFSNSARTQSQHVIVGPTVTTTTVPATRVVYQTNFRFGTQPVETTCPACNARVVTLVDKTYGPGAFLLSGLCICVGYGFS